MGLRDLFRRHRASAASSAASTPSAELQAYRLIKHVLEIIMATEADIKQQVADLTARVTANTDRDKAVSEYIDGLKGQVTTLSQQLADAIANQAPAADLQGISDALTALGQAIDADEAATAVVANTEEPAG